jgi:hypothetical protein
MAQQDDRWQATLNDGRNLWELRLVRFEGDTLVVRQADSTIDLAIGHVDELRLVRKSEHRTNEPGRYGDALGGTVDEVYRLTLYSVSERRQIIRQVLTDHPPQSAAAAPAPSDSWQITLKDGTIVWNLHLVRLERDTIVFREDTATVRYPLSQVDVLRLVRAGEHGIGPAAAGGRYDRAANGASDLVFQLTRLDLAERRHVVEEILRTRGPAPR